MIPSDFVQCTDFPCADVKIESYHVPDLDLDPQRVSILLISEAAAPDPARAGGSRRAPADHRGPG